jgi:hypothetical protein
MEPASIVGLVTSVAQLLVLTGKVSKDLHGLHEKYGSIASILGDLNRECVLLEVGLKRVKSRLQASGQSEDDVYLQICVDSFTQTLQKLSEEVEKLIVRNSAKGFRTRTMSKVSFLWNEDILKDHCAQVRNERAALHFVISSWNL